MFKLLSLLALFLGVNALSENKTPSENEGGSTPKITEVEKPKKVEGAASEEEIDQEDSTSSEESPIVGRIVIRHNGNFIELSDGMLFEISGYSEMELFNNIADYLVAYAIAGEEFLIDNHIDSSDDINALIEDALNDIDAVYEFKFDSEQTAAPEGMETEDIEWK